MQKKNNNQQSSCPQGHLPAGLTMPVKLTVKQQKYAARSIGISRAVYNTLVATHQLARAHGHGKWPTPYEMEKTFNDLKKHPTSGMSFVTEVSKFVAQGACRNFRNACLRWLDKNINAARPIFRKKNANGSGSFLAASGIAKIKYDGHRRIKLPGIGSVKLKRELPEGIPYEATIEKHLGEWQLSISYWKPAQPAELKTHDAGAADIGIQPLAVDSQLRPVYIQPTTGQRGRRPRGRPGADTGQALAL